MIIITVGAVGIVVVVCAIYGRSATHSPIPSGAMDCPACASVNE